MEGLIPFIYRVLLGNRVQQRYRTLSSDNDRVELNQDFGGQSQSDFATEELAVSKTSKFGKKIASYRRP
ncbi:hypothetical protein SUGI_0498910 [Cryptomeria japonica]|nr:hypothetical protein SUGI_0498910 [Cryptomeria japonica]